jgi:hypothetical protein
MARKITRLSKHLQEKAAANGVALSLIWEIVNDPGLTYSSFTTEKVNGKEVKVRRNCRCGQQQEKWTGVASNGQAFCVAVNVCCGVATTYWPDQVETELRPDQKAAGVTRYRGADGKWRS